MKLYKTIHMACLSIVAAGLCACSVDKDYDLKKPIDTDVTLFPGISIPVNQTLNECGASDFLNLPPGGMEMAAGEEIVVEYVLDMDEMGFDSSELDVIAKSFTIDAGIRNSIPLDLEIKASADNGTQLEVNPATVKAGTVSAPVTTDTSINVTTEGKISEIKRIVITGKAKNNSASPVKVTSEHGITLSIKKITVVSGFDFSF